MIKHHICKKIKFENLSFKKHIYSIIFLFSMLVIFLFTVQPTDIYNMESPKNKAIIIFLLSFNYAFILSIELLFINRKINNKKKLISSHILFTVIIIFTSLLVLYVRHPFMTKHHFFQYLSTTIVIVSVFQLLILFFIKKKFLIESITDNTNTSSRINIYDNKTTLSINSNNLIFIKSEGNYVTVFEKNKKYLIRSSLKKIIEQNSHPELIRCHKSYIVNSNKIKSISGNSKGYKISLLDIDIEIPVSSKIGHKIKEGLT